ncbi:DUF1206 domain-containing protein [Romeria aff. gracilis LEGE 07310]|uniref:DUF1206 domain-containing protein n=1 Tax=Vasconcelosia minhoensis LEGE 07310 TaxID=915328 RepID=A0A8J7AIQ8_9CYAN|nr:DUF1206 domain-containing protein [Romeria gracilis]MBE9078313.1 DUF1206 domain-containing protein [Romeria aff. gracilis LEGE 07310]
MDDKPAKWIEYLARFGYAAKGVIYITIGLLSARAAFGSEGKVIGSKGAVRTIAAQPFGQVLLVILSIGLIGYVIWRFTQAIKDPEHRGNDASDIVRRIAYAISGLVYGALAVFAIGLLIGSGGGQGGGSSSQSITSQVLSYPFGRWLVGTVGALFIGLAFYYFYRAIKAKFRKRFKLHEMSQKEEAIATWIGRFGVAARGVVYIVIGGFLIQAARTYDPSKVRTSEGALQSLQGSSFLPWMFGIVALGLIAYGIHMGFQARYRRINPEN